MTDAAWRPRILVIGTGSIGGIGRFERLLIPALDRIAETHGANVDVIWRRRHPGYLEHGRGTEPGEELPASRFALEVVKSLLTARPDLVLFLHVNLSRLAPVFRLFGTRRYAVYVYGAEVWQRQDRSRLRALSHATAIFTISDYTADETVAHQSVPREKIHSIPLALEDEWMSLSSQQPARKADRAGQAKRLLTVCRLESAARDKRVDDVIRALPEVLAADPRVTYHVVGDGDDRPRLESLAAEMGVAHAIMFAGLVSHDRLVREYREADVFVLPSEREGFGLVFLEAMAFGLPVIARRAAAAGEVIVDGVTGVLVDRSAQLGASIVALLADEDVAQRMGDAGARRARDEYSFARFASGVEAALMGATHR